ncbi:uncharacterized protein LOC113509034 isoform X4 [Trichoplusia ni]|uniref:Uncharacterized protein LOC113509034 isoform X4 n=1 Tax=Trichoplusia ni TaxID=7111 RepID=A0A7E5X4E4_TRINI|nr:uncharacterized protein LOC113509034 isoform X4 [Trichoplusia ni]
MTGRGRNYSQSNEWDSTRDDYNSSVYDAQYPDEDASGGVELDHCRLYIKNIPKGLNEEGLRAAFAKFGALQETFLSKDPQKNYGFVKFETPGEAKLAMMKMNRTEPLRLLINIAHKSKRGSDNRQRDNRDWQDRSNDKRERDRMSVSNRDRDDSGSVISRGRNSRVQDEIPNGENNMDELLMEDDYGFSDILDPNLHLELESLKLEQLKVREEQLQCKQRVILLKQAERRPMSQMGSNRCILPDGKIVVRSVNDRDSRDADVSFSAGAGDSRNALRQCVACGSPADAYCAGCGLTPYCSELCQKRDWGDRHSRVCHNLARKHGDGARINRSFIDNEPKRQNNNQRIVRDFGDGESRPEQPAPLRRPHMQNGNRRDQENDNVQQQQKFGNKNDRFNRFQDKPKHQPFMPKNQDKEIPQPKISPKKEPQQNKHPMFNKAPSKSPASSVNTPVKTPVAVEKKHNLVPASPTPVTKTPEVIAVPKQTPVPAPAVAPAPAPASASAIKPATVSDVTPTTKSIPKQYLIEKLSIGDAVILSVETKASDSRSPRGDYVCLSMSEQFETPYQSLCEDFVVDCDKDTAPYKLVPGDTCSYFNPEDGGWYRARCLAPTSLALLDSGRVVSVTAADKCRKLPSKYEAIPEFCCVLSAKNVEVGSNLSCKLLSQTADGYKLSMSDVDTGASVGEGEVFRWVPTVEYQTVPLIPEIDRPSITNDSRVLLVLANSLDRVFVRPASGESQRQYNDVLQRVLLSAMKAKPLEDPPRKGETIIAEYEDGNHYRALCRRTNVKQNKYQIEYAEFGNIEVTTLEKLFPCPPELTLAALPALVSAVRLADNTTLSPAATELVETLKDEEELVLTLPNGQQTAPSGSDATLTIAKNKVNLNRKLVEMCTPEWKKIEDRGGDVVETECIMFDQLKYASLPASCTLQVLDISVLRGGVLSGHDAGDASAPRVFGELTDKMAEYCNSELGREPYLPKPEELCIAQLPPYPQWFRAVLIAAEGSPGSPQARVCYLDYGNLAAVPVAGLRKMMADFLHYPAMGLHVEIRGFPSDPTDEQLARAVAHMNIDDEGRGTLRLTNCVKQTDGMYQVDAPELLHAMIG